MTFSERQVDFLPVYARRTKRLSQRLGQVGIALGGEAAVNLLPHLGLSGSRDTLLRLLRRDFVPATVSAATVVGIDDWAKRKGLKYGAIVVDLESGDVLDLRSDRSPEVIAAWLKQRPEIEMVSRDRSNQIREGIDQGAPQAIQVADRFHLLQNLTETIYKVIQPKQKRIKELFKTETADRFQDQPTSKDEPTAADLRRWDRIEQVHRLHETGWTAKALRLNWVSMPKQLGVTYGSPISSHSPGKNGQSCSIPINSTLGSVGRKAAIRRSCFIRKFKRKAIWENEPNCRISCVL
jgi:transposase